MEILISTAMVILALVFLGLVVKLLAKPIGWALKLLLNALMGFAALFILNFLGGYIGLSLTVSWFNAIVVGALGFPGIILLLLIKYLL